MKRNLFNIMIEAVKTSHRFKLNILTLLQMQQRRPFMENLTLLRYYHWLFKIICVARDSV